MKQNLLQQASLAINPIGRCCKQMHANGDFVLDVKKSEMVVEFNKPNKVKTWNRIAVMMCDGKDINKPPVTTTKQLGHYFKMEKARILESGF